MTREDVLISIVIGITTGLISGLIVTIYFRHRDNRAAEQRRKYQIFESWHNCMMKYIDMIEPMGDIDLKFLEDTWDVGKYDSKLMDKLIKSFSELKSAANEHDCNKTADYNKEAVINRAFEALDELSDLMTNAKSDKKTN